MLFCIPKGFQLTDTASCCRNLILVEILLTQYLVATLIHQVFIASKVCAIYDLMLTSALRKNPSIHLFWQ